MAPRARPEHLFAVRDVASQHHRQKQYHKFTAAP